MAVITGISPESVFHFFEEISKVPRGSGNTEKMTEYLANFSFERNLEGGADDTGNVVIYKEGSAGYEDAEPVILQAHTDMVCAKTAESSHDFSSDPIELILEGDTLRANGTTLGADDGIGVAMILAILDDPELAHPPLECVFTVDEEIGMVGADNFDDSVLEGRRLINLDSEKEGVIAVGCAGGIRVDSDIPIGRAVIRGMPAMVEISGLRGGHSGEEIDKPRLNALKLIARYFRELEKIAAFSLCDIVGGEKDNAIPVAAKSHFVIEEEDLQKVRDFTAAFETKLRGEYAGMDDAVRVILESGHTHKINVMDPESQDRVIHFLLLLPCGVAVLRDGRAFTSSSVGIARTGNGHFVATSLVRSASISQRDALADKITALTEYMKGNTVLKEGYLPWAFREESDLRRKMQDVAREFYGKELDTAIWHGGVECGLFSSRIKDLDAVSIGPDMTGIHTPDEKVSVSSVARTYEYLLKVLAALH